MTTKNRPISQAAFEFAAERLTTRELLVLGLRAGLIGEEGRLSPDSVVEWVRAATEMEDCLPPCMNAFPPARVKTIERMALSTLGYDTADAWIDDLKGTGPDGLILVTAQALGFPSEELRQHVMRREWRASDADGNPSFIDRLKMRFPEITADGPFTTPQWIGNALWSLSWEGSDSCPDCLERRNAVSRGPGRPAIHCSDACRTRAARASKQSPTAQGGVGR